MQVAYTLADVRSRPRGLLVHQDRSSSPLSDMFHFVLVRHGESQLNVLNRKARVFCGQTDTPLTDRGREQARTAGKMLAARLDRIVDGLEVLDS